ncbi:MAG: hypothetical protein DWQ01_19895 [Planctomycetota bacterium]|nr:MAG: hypothetical protein DWQ01_19895 [Planctomycetota bacterium]
MDQLRFTWISKVFLFLLAGLTLLSFLLLDRGMDEWIGHSFVVSVGLGFLAVACSVRSWKGLTSSARLEDFGSKMARFLAWAFLLLNLGVAGDSLLWIGSYRGLAGVFAWMTGIVALGFAVLVSLLLSRPRTHRALERKRIKRSAARSESDLTSKPAVRATLS